VKIQSLTPWCNLYSIESKYNIFVKPSRYKTIFYSVIPLCFVVISYILQFSVASTNTWLVLFLLSLSTFIYTLVWLANNPSSKRSSSIYAFALNENGQCYFLDNLPKENGFVLAKQFTDQCLQIQQSSRVGLWGCWLNFELVKEGLTNESLTNENLTNENLTNDDFIYNCRTKNISLFIFKDSVSSLDYARLCRIIKHLNSVPMAATEIIQ